MNEHCGARVRVLIVGAGIAGATLAALMRRRGDSAAAIERKGKGNANGYMLGLLPLGGRVLNGLGLREPYIAVSQPMHRYVLCDRNGQVKQTYEMNTITEKYGLYRGIERGALLDLILGSSGPIRYNASIRAIAQDKAAAQVTFEDGSEVRVDCMVMADGIHSHGRGLVLNKDEVTSHSIDWGGFVAWSNAIPADNQVYRELWAAGWGVGLYPVPGRTAMFLAGHEGEISGLGPFHYADQLLARGLPEPFADVLKEIDQTSEAVYWPMIDIRSKTWPRGRVVLLGDAAAAVLPTAGVRASMAMDSAAALSDELSRADPNHMSYALSLYEKRQRSRVERAQTNSRQLGQFMFIN